MSQPTPPQGSDPGAFGGAGLGGYNEGAFTLGPFFGHSVNYSVPPHTPGGASALPGGFRGRGPRGYQRSDERIREDVCERLLQDDYLDASDIEVSVKAGEVALNGTVQNRHAKRRAEDLVDLLSGVEHVQNNLRVKRR
jgi:hypothetical protein